MKPRFPFPFGACLLVLFAPVRAQFSLPWSTVDGGGGVSRGGGFVLRGTPGQPDAAGAAAGGAFVLAGGFWVMPIVLQNEEGPRLLMEIASPGMARFSWESSEGTYVLQEAVDLELPDPWSDSATGNTNPVTLPMSSSLRFFRLRKP